MRRLGTIAVVAATVLGGTAASSQVLVAPPDAPAVAFREPVVPSTPQIPALLAPDRTQASSGSLEVELNPVAVMARAGEALSGVGTGATREGGGLATVVTIMLLLTVLALAPSIMLMTTCFVRIVVVLALVRQAIGAQNLPPPQVVIALSLFMTMLVMAPTMERVYAEAVVPCQRGEITDYGTLWERASQPLRDFMFAQIEATGNWSSLYAILQYRGIDTSRPEQLTRADVDMVSLIPAFMLSELKTAFLMGFRVYLPFLVIDMVIATVLISMSMMMLPPVLVSLPFKLLLFVLVDGWQLVAGSLMASFVQPGSGVAAALGAAAGAGGGGW